jgi:hypothetical protein
MAAEYTKEYRFIDVIILEWKEIELIIELQGHLNDNIFFKFNNLSGISSEATEGQLRLESYSHFWRKRKLYNLK